MSCGVEKSGLVVCVAEDNEQFAEQVRRWFISLTRLAHVPASRLCVVFAGATTLPAWSEPLEDAGVILKKAPRFDHRSPHCNKIEGLSKVSLLGFERIVLSDCDLAFLADPRDFPSQPGAVSAKLVDRANPPVRILDTILQKADLSTPRRVRLSARPWRSTYNANANGGLIVIDGQIAKQFAEKWMTWARWLIDRADLLESWAIHVDQVAMFLTMIDLKVPFVPLDARHNFPTHRRQTFFIREPSGLHYHNKVNSYGALLPVGRRVVDRQIDRVNTLFSAYRDEMSTS